MPEESMVHALEKIHTLLKPEGLLLNIQPDDLPRPIEVHVGEERIEAGRSQHRKDFDTYRQAMAAIEQVVGAGLFAVEKKGAFSFFDEFDTVDELHEYVRDNWQNSILPDEVLQRAREIEAETEGETRAVVHEGVLIQRLRKLDN